MLHLGEISLFLTDDVYLINNDIVISQQQTEVGEFESENELEETIVEVPTVSIASSKPEPIHYNPVLFVFDVQLAGVPEEAFRNLVSKGLGLDEKVYSVITQEHVTFAKPEEVNSKKVILFGVPFSNYQTKYKLISNEKQLILVADSMDKIAENVDLKRQLWAQLQLMFPKSV